MNIIHFSFPHFFVCFQKDGLMVDCILCSVIFLAGVASVMGAASASSAALASSIGNSGIDCSLLAPAYCLVRQSSLWTAAASRMRIRINVHTNMHARTHTDVCKIYAWLDNSQHSRQKVSGYVATPTNVHSCRLILVARFRVMCAELIPRSSRFVFVRIRLQSNIEHLG